jgi:hypothetical protein
MIHYIYIWIIKKKKINNIFFLSSILIHLTDLNNKNEINVFLIDNIQWLIGSGFTIFLDFIIFYQFLN